MFTLISNVQFQTRGRPIFVYLDKSVKSRSDGAAALSAERVAKIMTMTLVAAGIEKTTTRSFRKTGHQQGSRCGPGHETRTLEITGCLLQALRRLGASQSD